MLILVGALIGAALSLVSSFVVRWRDRLRDRRTEIYLEALPRAVQAITDSDVGAASGEILQLHRLAIAAGPFDSSQTKPLLALIAQLNHASMQRHLASGDNSDPEFQQFSIEYDNVMLHTRGAALTRLRDYEMRLEHLLQRLV